MCTSHPKHYHINKILATYRNGGSQKLLSLCTCCYLDFGPIGKTWLVASYKCQLFSNMLSWLSFSEWMAFFLRVDLVRENLKGWQSYCDVTCAVWVWEKAIQLSWVALIPGILISFKLAEIWLIPLCRSLTCFLWISSFWNMEYGLLIHYNKNTITNRIPRLNSCQKWHHALLCAILSEESVLVKQQEWKRMPNYHFSLTSLLRVGALVKYDPYHLQPRYSHRIMFMRVLHPHPSFISHFLFELLFEDILANELTLTWT